MESPLETTEKQLIDSVIARIARGRYLMTACYEGSRSGALVESVQWLMTEPLLMGVSVRKGHEIDPLIRDSRSFAVGFIDDDDKFITRRFGKRLNGSDSAIHVEGLDPFETLETGSLVTGSPVLPQCSTWVDCEVLRRVDLENAHELFVGSVVGMIHDGQRVEIDPSEFGED
ncbi:MAG: flavin reductase [Phycisphaerales bacterium]|nr:flavin reductase [Phycisphaerales bacterium]